MSGDSEDAEIEAVVARHGWQAMCIDDRPPFLYTVGLMATEKHPEFVLFGLDSGTAHKVVSWLVKHIRAGRRFDQSCELDEVVQGGRIRFAFRPVHPTQHQFYFGYAMAFVRRNLPLDSELAVTQVFWPDKTGIYPFEANCELAAYLSQPRLDEPKEPQEIEQFEQQFE
jgi:hypothetical protein